MREDYQESLETMFPNGFLILYAQGDNVCMTMHNPKGAVAFPFFMDAIMEARAEAQLGGTQAVFARILSQLRENIPEREKLTNIKLIIEGAPGYGGEE